MTPDIAETYCKSTCTLSGLMMATRTAGTTKWVDNDPRNCCKSARTLNGLMMPPETVIRHLEGDDDPRHLNLNGC